MDEQKAFAKRLRRHVVGRVREYFAVTAPGLEGVCAAELAGPPLGLPDLRPMTGGVAFAGRLEDCWLANLHLRTATRILMRITEFKAAAFHQLQARLDQIPWELFLPARPFVRVRATLHGCRLFHSRAVVQRAEAVIQARQGKMISAGSPDDIPQTIYLRGLDDRFTISIDTSGESLYRRGLKTHGGRAPIRETLAAAVLLTAGHGPGTILVDPMCGSGTFSLEGAMMGLAIPAGWFRLFAFMHWPSFAPRRWDHLRNRHRPRIPDTAVALIFASDEDAQTCRRLGQTLAVHGLQGCVQVGPGDFFGILPSVFPGGPGLLVLNPPYGHRLGDKDQVRGFYQRLWAQIRRTWTGWNLALVTPASYLPASLPKGLGVRPLVHGGLNLSVVCGRING